MAKVFIVFAHPERNSFNGAMLKTAEDALRGRGDEVRVSDLYAMNFNPVVGAGDFTSRKDADRLDYFGEQRHGYETGTLADDIKAEIDKIAWCDLLILQFPIYWFALPAMLKGWVDRVFVPGFAFGAGKWYERGGLAGKRAMISATMSAYAEMMAPDGLNGYLDVSLWPIQNGILAFCGFDVLAPFVVNGVPHVDDAGRAKMIEAYKRRLASVHTEQPLRFHRREEFDKQWKLKPDVEPRTVGHFFSRVPGDVLERMRKPK